MASTSGEIESVLAVDIGSVNTRAVLFDLVGITYRMLAAGSAPSTHLAPIRDAQEGVWEAVHQLEEITGRNLLDTNHRLVIPASTAGSGVDHLMLSSSAGADIRIAAIGLLDEFSLANIEKLAGGMYTRIVERFTLNDSRKPEERLNAFIQSNPDLVLMAGGTNRGATRAVLRLTDQLRLGLQACQPEKRPLVLYAGNEVLKERVKETLENLTTVFLAPNIFPFASANDTGPAEETLIQVLNTIRSNQMKGFGDLERISGLPVLPSSSSEARIIRFQSLQQDSTRTVIGVNVGSAASHFITACAGETRTVVHRGLGVGQAAQETLARVGIESILHWLSLDIPQSVVRDYLWQKSLFPAGLPMDAETLDIEQAAARAILSEMKRSYFGINNASLQGFEPLLAGGAVIAQAPSLQQSLLMVLDGLQPSGITTVLCDRFSLLSALGASTAVNPALVVQVLETGVLNNLGTVISPIIRARTGEIVMRIRLQEEDVPERTFEIRKGEIVRLPLGLNKTAKLLIKSLKHMESFPGARNLKVVGGELGVIIDTRGRPIHHPSDPGVRRENNLKWNKSLQECLA
jgi:hypothetical protein